MRRKSSDASHDAELAGRLPYYEQAQVSPEQHAERIAARQAAVAVRMLG